VGYLRRVASRSGIRRRLSASPRGPEIRVATQLRTVSAGVGVAALILAVAPTVAGARATRSPGPHSAGCGSAVTAGTTDEAITSGGAARRYRLAVPADSGQRALPLILNFHGFSSDAGQQAIYSQLEAKGPPRGYAVATPQGTGTPAFWNILPKLPAPDDVAFTNALIDHLEQTRCIDPTRVYSTGISNGAGMSALLGCRIPNRLAAIAPVAGVNLVAGCPKGAPMSVLAFHGSADPVVAYRGARSSFAQIPVVAVPKSVATWAKRAGCGSTPTIRKVTPHVQRTSYPGCTAGTNVELYTIIGGGHTWPGSIDLAYLGATTHEINATDLILAFFAHHTRPGAK
jgi:polyhydroxybutyrate depolymerase